MLQPFVVDASSIKPARTVNWRISFWDPNKNTLDGYNRPATDNIHRKKSSRVFDVLSSSQTLTWSAAKRIFRLHPTMLHRTGPWGQIKLDEDYPRRLDCAEVTEHIETKCRYSVYDFSRVIFLNIVGWSITISDTDRSAGLLKPSRQRSTTTHMEWTTGLRFWICCTLQFS